MSTWEQLMEFAGDLIGRYWIAVAGAVVLFVIGRWWQRQRDRSEWKKKEFKGRLMVSLNSIHTVLPDDQELLALGVGDAERKLAIRTLFEDSVEEIVQNQEARQILMNAAKKTTVDDPIIPIPEEHRWFVLNEILNTVAALFAPGTLCDDMGMPTAKQWYLICLTNERDGEVRIHKPRAMVVRKDRLLDGSYARKLSLESENHATRLKTLEIMRKRFKTEPGLFLQMEIGIPAVARKEVLRTTTRRR